MVGSDLADCMLLKESVEDSESGDSVRAGSSWIWLGVSVATLSASVDIVETV